MAKPRISPRARILSDPGHVPKNWRAWGWHHIVRYLLAPKPKRRPPTPPPVNTVSENIRDDMVRVGTWGIAHAPVIHYSQRRPILLPSQWRDETTKLLSMYADPSKVPGFFAYTDCSGSTTQCAFVAGAPDPNGFNYSGSGYSGSEARHLRQIALKDAKRGDLVIFGIPVTHHVAFLLVDAKNNPDPWLFSHGEEQGPLKIKYSVERAWHLNAGHGDCRVYSLL